MNDEAKTPVYYTVPQNTLNTAQNCLQCELLYWLVEQRCKFNWNCTGVEKIVSECVCNMVWIMVSEKNGHNNSSHTYTSPHKNPTLHIGGLWIKVGKTIILRVHMSTEMKPSFTAK